MGRRLTQSTVNFLVERVKPLQLNPDAFEDLVLPAQYKALILSFAKQQDEKVQEVDDIISGKGLGLPLKPQNVLVC